MLVPMRGRGLVAAVVAALVLLVVPLALGSLHTRGDTTMAAPTKDPTPASALVDVGDPEVADSLTCEGEVVPPASLPLTGSLEGARLCATTPRYRRWTAPEPLFDQLDVLAAGIARLEPAPEDYMCFQGGGSYHYDLRLAVDGKVVSLRTQPSCLEFSVGGVDYLNTDEPFDAFLAALTTQRSRLAPPTLRAATALDCTSAPLGTDHALSPLGDPLAMVDAVSCWRPDSTGDVGPWRGGTRVPPAQLKVLMADLRANVRNGLGPDADLCADEGWYWQDLLGRTRWGDVVVIRGACDGFMLDAPDATSSEEQGRWHPSARSQRILDGLRR